MLAEPQFSNPPTASVVVVVDPSLGFATFMCRIITTVVTQSGHKKTINNSSRRACGFCGAEGLPVLSCERNVFITWRLGRSSSRCRRWYCRGRCRGRGRSTEALWGRCVGDGKLETVHACRCGVGRDGSKHLLQTGSRASNTQLVNCSTNTLVRHFTVLRVVCQNKAR